MATFFGSGSNDVITPTNISGGVFSLPAFQFPSFAVADTLFGGDGNDTLNGGGGNDASFGGNGNDYIFAVIGTDTADGGGDIDTLDTTLYTGDYAVNLSTGLTNFAGESFINFENLISGDGNDTLTGTSGSNVLDGGAGSDTIFGGFGNDTLFGRDGNDTLDGGLDNDTLDGGVGADSMNGGDGNDTYFVDNLSDIAEETLAGAFGGNDTVFSSVTHTMGFGMEILTLTGSAAINGTGNFTSNVILGNSASNILSGLGGSDTLFGGAGNDTLDGGTGADRMNGEDGNDTYFVDNSDDVAFEDFSDLTGGLDTVFSSVTHIIGFGIENLTLTGVALINGTGNALGNVIFGNNGSNILSGLGGGDTLFGANGNDTLDGGTGADRMNGGDEDDTYFVDDLGDVTFEDFSDVTGGLDTVFSSVTHIIGTGIENLTLTGAALTNGTGNTLDNVILGNTGSNILTGLEGNDTLNGGGGNDTLFGGEGSDTLNGGGGNDASFGGSGNDYIFAVIGTDTADGGDDIDTLDTTLFAADYVVDLSTGLTNFAGESFINFENLISGDGNDTLTGTSGSNVLDGGAGSDTIFGGFGDDTLFGGEGNDDLDGGVGADSMNGGDGNDTYYVDDLGDITVETFDDELGGVDTVLAASVTHTIGFGIENLTLFGFVNINGTGNALGNVILGNFGANVLTGLAGDDSLHGGDMNDVLLGGTENDTLNGGLNNDTLDGGAGDDTASYFDATGPVKVSLASAASQNTGLAGFDTLISIENLIGSGFNDTLTGNGLGNRIEGGAGRDKINGGAGADTMIGGADSDTYTVDNALDTVIEDVGGGTKDLVNSSVTWFLDNNFENLTLTGTATINGFGNNQANTIKGNGGNNELVGFGGKDVITGGGGNDRLIGGAVADVLTGGTGADSFVFDTLGVAADRDTVKDFTVADDTFEFLRSAYSGFDTTALGTLTAAEVAFGTAAVLGTQHLIYNQATGALFYDEDGVGLAAQVQIAVLSNRAALTLNDFVLI